MLQRQAALQRPDPASLRNVLVEIDLVDTLMKQLTVDECNPIGNFALIGNWSQTLTGGKTP